MAFSYYTKRGGSRFGIKSTKMTLKTREYIVQLIVRQVQGILDDEGQRELLEWRESSPENEVLFQRMTSRVHFEESLKVCEMTNEEMENDRKLPFGLKTVATVCGDTGCGPVGWRNLGVGREGFLVTR